MFDSLRPHRLYSLWTPCQNTGVGSLSLLQWIFPTQGSHPGFLHCRCILYQLSQKGSPRKLEWVAHPFSKGIFLTQQSNPGGLLQYRQILSQLSYQTILIEKMDFGWWDVLMQVHQLWQMFPSGGGCWYCRRLCMFGGIKAYVKSLYLLLNSAANPKLLLKKFCIKKYVWCFCNTRLPNFVKACLNLNYEIALLYPLFP